MSRYRLAVDIGGTFTDTVLYDMETGEYVIGKNLTTPANQADGVITGLERMIDDWSRVSLFVHGTTAGVNSFLQRRGARVALITTAGFRDVYEIGRTNRTGMYDLFYRKPEPLVPRADVFELAERLGPDGQVICELDREQCRQTARLIADRGFDSVAVCLLFSYINPEHELMVRDIVQEHAPGVSVTLSHVIANEWREYERTSTAVINAYVAPTVERYLTELEARVADRDLGSQVYLMQSAGGLMTAGAARDLPVQTLFSGPVGGTIGGQALGEQLDTDNLLCVDMGGTSFDVSLVVDGRADVRTETVMEGFPLLMPIVNIHSIGAGGGSIAYIEGGGLRVGPRSAGADPGPVCYGRGGTEPTVTDANLCLGRLSAAGFLGGDLELDSDGAGQAVADLGQELRMDVAELAEGIVAIVNAKMAGAIRQLTVQKGIDPRDFTMVAFGGAGPMHAAFLADELQIGTVIIPPASGTFSAWGMLQTDLRHDVAATLVQIVDELNRGQLAAEYRELETTGREALAAQGMESDRISFLRHADMRYVGQEYSVTVDFGDRPIDSLTAADIADLFHETHRVQYGHCNRSEAVEFVTLRLAAVGGIDRPGTARFAADQSHGGRTTRRAYFDGRWLDTTVVWRDMLGPGSELAGPAIVQEKACTTVLPPGFAARVDRAGNIVISRIVTGDPEVGQ